MSADLLALLDQLDEARASIGDSPAFRVVGFVQDDEAPEQVLARFDDGGMSVFAECYGEDSAALIVAAVNAAPKLTAALRAVLALTEKAEERIRQSTPPITAERLIAEGEAPTVTTGAIRDAITAARTPEPVQP